MGYFCIICCCERPNEQFSGKGRKKRICKKCMLCPAEERDSILALGEIYQYWHRQRNISAKNQKRLRELSDSPDKEVAESAKLILEVSLIYPHKKKRIRKIKASHPTLFAELKRIGFLIDNETVYDDSFEEENVDLPFSAQRFGINVFFTKWLADEPHPGLVEFAFTDAHGKRHVFQEQFGIVIGDFLDEYSFYPQPAILECMFIERCLDENGRVIILVDTEYPWGVESIAGDMRFEVELLSFVR